MKLYLVRHADAEAEPPEGLGDEGRSLTLKARGQALGHFTALSERMTGLQVVLTSPLVRTVQTAQLLSLALKHEGSLRAHRSLQPEMPVGKLEQLLADFAGEASVALVGHQPIMGAFAAHLLGLQSFPRPVQPGTVVGLEFAGGVTPGAARLLFYAPMGQPLVEAV
ncbi:MAG: hypothetical protein RL653_1027 [Pseudomonadota bacterium]